MKKEKRKLGVIYTNTDELGHHLTYSVLIKLSNGKIIELERNSRNALKPFLKKYD